MQDPRAELVRIANTGEAHAIGKIASQRLRARAGTYRMLPSPNHVVFMRYTGEDGNRDPGDGAIVRVGGEITHPGALCDVLAMLGQTGWRGELQVFDDHSSRSLFCDQGNVLGATTTVDEERLGEVLYRFGIVTEEQHSTIKQAMATGGRYGETAVNLGILLQDQVYQHIRKQIEAVTYAALMVADGTFFFLDDFDESRLVTRHAVSINALLMDGVTRMDEMRYFREKIPSADHVPVKLENRDCPGPEFIEVYEAIDGKRNIEEVGRVTGRGEFSTTKVIYTLVQSKHVAIHPPRISGGAHALVEIANEALRAIFRVTSEVDGIAGLRDNLSSFAIGAGVYDILFRGAGPDIHGVLDAGRVAENAIIVAQGADPENLLKQMLHDYVGFALFSAGGPLSSDAEERLKREVDPILSRLRPMG